MRALVLSSVFPNPKQPTLGVFVRERMLRVARRCELRVVAPLPWFPLNRLIRGARATGIPATEHQGPLQVYHPRFFCVPRHGKWLDGALYGLSLLPFVRRLKDAFPFDLIDAHFAYPDGLGAIILGKAFRRPVVITLRGSIVRLSTYPSHRPQIRWALRQAADVIAVSQSLREVAVGLGIPSERVTVVPNGVDGGTFRISDKGAARRACGLPEGATVILSVGGIYEDKGQHCVLEALPALVARHPRLLYVMVGEARRDAYRDRLERLIAQGGMQAHVRFVGARPHEEMPTWYAAADLLCLATRSEGWANVFLEALACAVPVVATRVGGNAEVVRDERYGLLVPYGDTGALREALLRGLDTSWDRPALAAYAAAQTWEAVADRVVERFQHVLARATSVAAQGAGVPAEPRR